MTGPTPSARTAPPAPYPPVDGTQPCSEVGRRHVIFDVDTAIGARQVLADYYHLRDQLVAYRLPTFAIDRRIHALTAATVDVLCYVCARRTVTVSGVVFIDRPVCAHCAMAACDAPYCFAPAEVAITTATSVHAWCARHGMGEFLTLPAGGARLRHLPGATARRDACDARQSLAATA